MHRVSLQPRGRRQPNAFICPAPPPSDSENQVSDPQGLVPSPFIFKLSQVNATELDGGSVKVVDSTTFPVSTAIAVAEVTVEPGAMRELHVSSESPLDSQQITDTGHSGIPPRTSGRTICEFDAQARVSESPYHPAHTSYRGGTARVTLFGSSSNARTFNFQVGVVPLHECARGPIG